MLKQYIGKCPHCRTKFNLLATAEFEARTNYYTVGTTGLVVYSYVEDTNSFFYTIQLKEFCHSCLGKITMLISSRHRGAKLLKFIKSSNVDMYKEKSHMGLHSSSDLVKPNQSEAEYRRTMDSFCRFLTRRYEA